MKISKKQLKQIIKEELQLERKGMFLEVLEEAIMATVQREFASYNWPPEQWAQLKADIQKNGLDLTQQVLALIEQKEASE
tara:strand:- start:404 stop:643 length:240 start_codon:yes stop_codon:yes gene_type:complete